MDFWEMSIDDALSGTPVSTAEAEVTLMRYASSEIMDSLSSMPISDAIMERSPEEIDASNVTAIEKSTPSKSSKREKPDASKDQNAVSLKKAYFEVKKLAISGMQGAEKEEAKVRMAVGLGAKPKKRKYTNYKDLKNERREAKKAAKDDASLKLRTAGIKKKKSKDTGKKSKKIKKKMRK